MKQQHRHNKLDMWTVLLWGIVLPTQHHLTFGIVL